jgi:hypothetical protein
MKVEVEQAITRAYRGQPGWGGDLVQQLVEVGEQGGVAAKCPWPPPQLVQHRRALDPFQHERVGGDLEDARYRIPVTARMLHDASLSLRITSDPKTTEHPAIAKIENV